MKYLISALVLIGSGVAVAATAGASFSVTDPADWAYADAAVSDMAQDWGSTWTAEEGHSITYGVVDDQDETGIAYFATTRDNDSGGTQLSIFRYDTGSYEFARLWRDDDAGDAKWHVVGYDNGSVVVAQTAGTYDRGACGEPMVESSATLYSLPDSYSESWDAGLTAYTAQQADLDEVSARQSDCEVSDTGG